MRNKTLKSIDLSEKLKPYENKWVVLSLDHKKVLGAGNTLKEAKAKTEKKCKEEVIFMKVPPFDMAYVPTTL